VFISLPRIFLKEDALEHPGNWLNGSLSLFDGAFLEEIQLRQRGTVDRKRLKRLVNQLENVELGQIN
jgi:hypothetical protein